MIHLPDYEFVKKCREIYGLNRGVYNIIDSWFYNNGITSITERRKLIIKFLETKKDHIVNGRLIFGPNKLTLNLQAFFDFHIINVS